MQHSDLCQYVCACIFQEYSVFPGEQVSLSIVPVDSLGSHAAFVFGFAQSVEGSTIPTGRIARYLDLSSAENVVHFWHA